MDTEDLLILAALALGALFLLPRLMGGAQGNPATGGSLEGNTNLGLPVPGSAQPPTDTTRRPSGVPLEWTDAAGKPLRKNTTGGALVPATPSSLSDASDASKGTIGADGTVSRDHRQSAKTAATVRDHRATLNNTAKAIGRKVS